GAGRRGRGEPPARLPALPGSAGAAGRGHGAPLRARTRGDGRDHRAGRRRGSRHRRAAQLRALPRAAARAAPHPARAQRRFGERRPRSAPRAALRARQDPRAVDAGRARAHGAAAEDGTRARLDDDQRGVGSRRPGRRRRDRAAAGAHAARPLRAPRRAAIERRVVKQSARERRAAAASASHEEQEQERNVFVKPYRLHGMVQSYFTRKMTGYLEYKGIPYLLRRFYGMSEESLAAGFPGGIPAMQTPDGEWMW